MYDYLSSLPKEEKQKVLMILGNSNSKNSQENQVAQVPSDSFSFSGSPQGIPYQNQLYLKSELHHKSFNQYPLSLFEKSRDVYQNNNFMEIPHQGKNLPQLNTQPSFPICQPQMKIPINLQVVLFFL